MQAEALGAQATRGEFPPGPPEALSVFELLERFAELRRDVLGLMAQRFAVYGDLVHAQIEGVHQYHACHPELFHEVLVTQAEAFKKRTTDLELLGKGLLMSDGEFWRQQRRRIQPGFRRESLERYAEMFQEETEKLIQSWRPGQAFELRTEMMSLTLRIVCRTLFGQRFEGSPERLARAMNVLQEAVVRPKLLPPWIPTPSRWRHERMAKFVDARVYAIIDRARYDESSLLFQLSHGDEAERMSRSELRDEVVTLFLAGHETTALALTWTLYLLALHPQVEADVVQEIQQVVGTGPVHARHLTQLVLTHRALQESMRLYPPVYVIPRVATQSLTLGGYRVSKGSEVWLWTYFMQRDSRWYAMPERFQPERFAGTNEATPGPRRYLPFGHGTRTCVGRHFATFEAVLILAMILRSFRLTVRDGLPLRPLPRITLAPGRPLHVGLERRRPP